MTDLRDLCARMADELDLYRQVLADNRKAKHPLATEARAALAELESERLTVEEISNLPKHGENYVCDGRGDKIELDGCFSRADLQQLADSIPNNRSNSHD